ncbi:MAG: MBL fold metallo-hydrolase [Phycisphaerales bacterium JB040]
MSGVRDIRFTFLGTGTSAGVPVIGCDCATCTSTDPRDARLRTSACLRFTDGHGQRRTVLLDAGPDLRQQSLAAGLDRCDAILITHNHVDHVWGLDEVRRFNALMGSPIDVWGDGHTLESLRRVYRHVFEPHSNVQKSFIAELIARELTPLDPIELYGLRVTPLPLLHGRLPVLGFRLEHADGSRDGVLPLAYCTDVSAIPPETWAHLEGLSVLVLDALRFRRHPTHLTVGQAESIASRVGADRTFFVHMTHDVRHEETESDLGPGIRLAYDGMELLSSTDVPQES